MQCASHGLEWSRKTRIQVISETLNSDCVETCREKYWLKCAKKILRNNKINQYFFASAMRNALIKGTQKNNILIVGPTNCGKSFLLNPLELIFNAYLLTPQQQNTLGPTLKTKKLLLSMMVTREYRMEWLFITARRSNCKFASSQKSIRIWSPNWQIEQPRDFCSKQGPNEVCW